MKKARGYTDEQHKWLLENYKTNTYKDLHRKFNETFGTEKTFHAIKSYLGNRKLRIGVKDFGKYTDEMIEFIRVRVKEYTDKEIAVMMNEKWDLNVNDGTIGNIKTQNGIRSGVNRGTFQKGQVPFNKGMKQTDFMSPEMIERTKATRFQKGQKPTNHRPVGSERITVDGFVEIKVKEPNVWRPKQRVLWEQEHGSIPKGHVVIFLDGNKQNMELSNLRLITQEENAYLNKNGLRFDDRDLTETGLNLTKIMTKVHEIKRGD